MLFEIGISSATWPYATSWTGVILEAENIDQAEDMAADYGFYRNVDVRIVTEGS